MSKKSLHVQGGTDLLVKMMREELVKNGVDIALNSPVEKIIIEHGAVAGVKVADGPMTVESPEIGGVPKTVSPLAGKTIKTRSVLSNANLKGTIFNLVGREYFEPEFVAEAEAVRLNNSSVQVYIALKEGETLDEERCGDLFLRRLRPNSAPIGSLAAILRAAPIRSTIRRRARARIDITSSRARTRDTKIGRI